MINLADLQGNILRGYTNRPHVRYLVLEVVERSAARGWLAELRIGPQRCAADHMRGLGGKRRTPVSTLG